MSNNTPHSEIHNLFRRNWTRADLNTMYAINHISTMSTSRMQAVMDGIRHVKKNKIEGDLVECGVFRGGNIALGVKEMVELELTDRTFWAYDTFTGVPKTELSEIDREIEQHSAGVGASVEKWYLADDTWCFCDEDNVRDNVIATLGTLLPDMNSQDLVNKYTKFIKGSVIDTIPDTLPNKISFIRLDMDIAVPTEHTLPYIWEKMSIGASLHIDDYNMFNGVHQVVDEFIKDKPHYMHEIDYTAVSIVKL